ncbi:MAG: hypothetical protein J1E42_04285 [Akkermansiaceae bacterium]|nr:hypothetical protein [Akkermansiaceae bacterium]
MPRSAPQKQWRILRRYALSGDTEAARRTLLHMRQQFPGDAEVTAELQRLEAGEPLRITESQRERRARLLREAATTLAHDTSLMGAPRRLSTARTHQLRALHRRLQQSLRLIRASQAPLPPGVEAYRQNLEQELARRAKRRRKALLLILGGAAAAAVLAGGALLTLRNRAQELTRQLEQAYQRADWEQAGSLLTAADSGIHRLLYPRLEQVITNAENARRATAARAQALHRRLLTYEQSRQSISTLTLTERAELLRLIRSLPAPQAAPLLARWDALCRPEKEQLEAQKEAVLRELAEPLLPPELTGDTAQDIPLLRESITRLRQRLKLCEDACENFGLSAEALTTPAARQLSEAELTLAEATRHQSMLRQLASARTYAEYQHARTAPPPRLYAPALEAARAMPPLLSPARMQAELRAARHGIPAEPEPALLQALLHRGPSFGPTCPAEPEQVHLMEDLFTAQSLRRATYEVTGPGGDTHYSDTYPQLTRENSVVFNVSELDPTHHPARARVEWKPSQAVWIRYQDPTPILRATGIARESFFMQANLPDQLERLTHITAEDCPALAKAYAYHTLLELVRLHRRADMLGLAYSPTLAADAASFRELEKRCGFPLSATCWLQRTSASLAAEQAYAAWFAEHAQRHYCDEIAREFGRIMHRTSRYMGYASPDGQAQLKHDLPAGATLRYFSSGRLIASPAQQPLQAPDPYTPIFTD